MDIKRKLVKFIRSDQSDLPSLDAMAKKIIQIASDPNASADELTDVIKYDQGMTNKLLKLSNSIYYAQRIRVHTVKRAVAVIGFNEILGIALSMQVLSAVSRRTERKINMEGLLMHGIGVATASKEIAERTIPEIADKMFIPGLLHDVGKMIFSLYFTQEYQIVGRYARKEKKPLYVAENAVLGLDHARMIGILMKHWHFPRSIIAPCRYHHHPDKAPQEFRRPSLILNFADYITQKIGIGHSGNPVQTKIQNPPEEIGIDQSYLKNIIDLLRNKEEGIKEFYNIIDPH